MDRWKLSHSHSHRRRHHEIFVVDARMPTGPWSGTEIIFKVIYTEISCPADDKYGYNPTGNHPHAIANTSSPLYGEYFDAKAFI